MNRNVMDGACRLIAGVLAILLLAGPDDPGPTITFDDADSDLCDEYHVLGATIVAMPAGSSLSLHDALSVRLITSASNDADAVATWAFGSEGAVLRAAREWLAANGPTGTSIIEPTGVSRRNTSTPAVYDDGERVGTITWTAGPRTETVAVEIEDRRDPPSARWRLTSPGALG